MSGTSVKKDDSSEGTERTTLYAFEIPDSPKEIVNSLKSLFKENLTLLGAIFLAIGSVWVGIEVTEKIDGFRKLLFEHLADGFKPPLDAKTESLESWLAGELLVLGLLLLVFLFYSISAFSYTKALRKEIGRIEREKSEILTDHKTVAAERDKATGALTQLDAERS